MKKWQEIVLIVLGGALGGVASAIDAWADPITYPLSFAKVFSLAVIPFIKGGIAGGIGVYLLTAIDPAQVVRAFFFSIACGLAFPSILSKGKSMTENVMSQVAQQTIIENASIAADTSASVQEVSTAADNILAARERILGHSRHADAALQSALENLSAKATEADTNPINALKAIGEIGTHSALEGIPGPRVWALNELKTLQSNMETTYAAEVGIIIDGLQNRVGSNPLEG